MRGGKAADWNGRPHRRRTSYGPPYHGPKVHDLRATFKRAFRRIRRRVGKQSVQAASPTRRQLRVCRCGELQREERVTAGDLVDPAEKRPREGEVEPFVNQPMDRAERERLDDDLLDAPAEVERRCGPFSADARR